METDTTYFEAFEDWLTLRNYAASTKRAYASHLRGLLLWRQRGGMKGEITGEHIRAYLISRSEDGLSWRTINVIYSSLQLFTEGVLKQVWSVEHLPRPRGEKELPPILSVVEVERLINAGSLLKHQAFMALLYGTGLRLSEALDLRIRDINGDRQQLRVVRGKGRKDRYVSLPPSLLELLRVYYKACRPVEYLFNGTYPGGRWSNRAPQVAIANAALAAGILKPVTSHVLRHCYATHHLEKGTSILILKDQLGHSNLQTTSRYLHLCANYQQQMYHPLCDLKLSLCPKPERLGE